MRRGCCERRTLSGRKRGKKKGRTIFVPIIVLTLLFVYAYTIDRLSLAERLAQFQQKNCEERGFRIEEREVSIDRARPKVGDGLEGGESRA